MRLRDGGTYRTRGGRIYTVRDTKSGAWPFVATDTGKRMTWDAAGCYNHLPCPDDLVEEVTHMTPRNDLPDRISKLKLCTAAKMHLNDVLRDVDPTPDAVRTAIYRQFEYRQGWVHFTIGEQRFSHPSVEGLWTTLCDALRDQDPSFTTLEAFLATREHRYTTLFGVDATRLYLKDNGNGKVSVCYSRDDREYSVVVFTPEGLALCGGIDKDAFPREENKSVIKVI